MPILTHSRLLLCALWVGSGWSLAGLVLPTVFWTLVDRSQAGDVAGNLLRVHAWLGFGCGVALLLLSRVNSRRGDAHWQRSQLLLVCLMLLCTAALYFGLQPVLAAWRETAALRGGMSEAMRVRFALLHGAAALLFLVQNLAGTLLLVKLR